MSPRRRKLTKETEEKVLFRSRRRCCLCVFINGDLSVKQVQIAHVDQNRDNNRLDNLVALCLNHHDEFDSKRSQSKGITASEIKHYRHELDQLNHEFYQRLKLSTTNFLEDWSLENSKINPFESNKLVLESASQDQKVQPEEEKGYYHSGERRILLTGFEGEFYQTVVEGLLNEFATIDDLFRSDPDGKNWRDWERNSNMEGFVFPWIKTGVFVFDSLDVDVKEIALKHTLDVLTNPSSDYPAFIYDEKPYYLAGEAFAVAPLWWLANYAIPHEIEMYQIEEEKGVFIQWRKLVWLTWLRLKTKYQVDSSITDWKNDPKTHSPFFGAAENHDYLPLCPESTNQEAWWYIICQDLACYLLDVMDEDWQDIYCYELTRYSPP